MKSNLPTQKVTQWLYAVLVLPLAFIASSFTYANDEQISQPELDQLLAPIALYPDTVLSHVLIASTYPLEVVMAQRWIEDHPRLKGDAAINAAESEDWDPSVTALVAFPDLVERMSQDLDWTQRLGEAFLADEERVLASVQQLRQRALESGHLQNMDNLQVEHDDNYIVIQPRVRHVVYLPWYDTRVVYGPWWWAGWQPYYWHTGYRHHHHHRWVSWGPSVSIRAGFWFSAFHWHHHSLVVHHHHRHNYYSRYDLIHRRKGQRWHHAVRHRRSVAYRHYANDRIRHYEAERKRYIHSDKREYLDRDRTKGFSDKRIVDREKQNRLDARDRAQRAIGRDVRSGEPKNREKYTARDTEKRLARAEVNRDMPRSSERRSKAIREYLDKERTTNRKAHVDKGQKLYGSERSTKTEKATREERRATEQRRDAKVVSKSKTEGRVYQREAQQSRRVEKSADRYSRAEKAPRVRRDSNVRSERSYKANRDSSASRGQRVERSSQRGGYSDRGSSRSDYRR